MRVCRGWQKGCWTTEVSPPHVGLSFSSLYSLLLFHVWDSPSFAISAFRSTFTHDSSAHWITRDESQISRAHLSDPTMSDPRNIRHVRIHCRDVKCWEIWINLRLKEKNVWTFEHITQSIKVIAHSARSRVRYVGGQLRRWMYHVTFSAFSQREELWTRASTFA